MNGIDGYSIRDGQLVSDKVARIVQAIHEYEPLIEVQWIPEAARAHDSGIAAFRIVYNDPNSPIPLVMFHVKSEEDFDERVLQRIIVNDQRNGTVTLSDFEAWEEAQKLVARQKYLDQLEEAQDIAKHILATHKNTYKVNDDLIIKEGIPFNAARLRK